MRRSLLLLFVSLFASLPGSCQSSPADSQTLQSLLSEVRQLRQELRATAVAAQRAQILLYRLQAQQSVVRRLHERVDDSRSKLAQIRYEQRRLTNELKQFEDSAGRDDNPAKQKEGEEVVAELKTRLETQTTHEQEEQAKLAEGEEQLRIEQEKLGGLEDQLDQLEKTLENSGRPPSSRSN